MVKISASIVLFHNNRNQLKRVIDSFFNTKIDVKLYLVDNSITDELKDIISYDKRIEYIFNNNNLGYGAGHNIAIRKSIMQNIKYHVVLNPDLYFEGNVIEHLFNYMNKHKDVGNIMPNVLYPNGDNQYLAKLLPTPLDWILRRFLPSKLTKSITERFELKYTGYETTMNVPFLSGCFMFLRTKTLEEVGLFDEDIFMYMEDVDLNRRIHSTAKTLYYPKVEIYHEYERGSYKSFKLLFISIQSSVKYFNKWGWIFDSERKKINNKVLRETNYE